MTIGQFNKFEEFLIPSRLISTFVEIDKMKQHETIYCECSCGEIFKRNKYDLMTIEKYNEIKNRKKNFCFKCSKIVATRFATYLKYYKLLKSQFIKVISFKNITFLEFVLLDYTTKVEYLCEKCNTIHVITFGELIQKYKILSKYCSECNSRIKGLKISKLKYANGFNFETRKHENTCTVCSKKVTSKKENIKNDYICSKCRKKKRNKIKKSFVKPSEYYFNVKLENFKKFKNNIKDSNIIKIFPKNSKFAPIVSPQFSALIKCTCGNKFFITSRQVVDKDVSCSVCKSGSLRDVLTFDEVKVIEPNLYFPIKEFYNRKENIKILCDCGNIEERLINDRLARKCSKCKRKKSHGESKIENFLQRFNIF